MSRLSIDIRYTGAAAIRDADWNRVLRAAGTDMGVYWHLNFRPKRFSNIAYTEYNARYRSRPYEKAKKAVKGHYRPLDYSGDSRREASRRKVTAIIRRKGGLSVSVRGARGLNRRPKTTRGRRAIHMLQEFKAWSPRERVKLQKVMRQRTLYHLRKYTHSLKVHVRLRAA